MPSTPDLSIKIGNITFKNPFIVGSGPTVRTLEQIKMAEDAGWAGASIKLAIEPFPYLNFPPRYRWLKKDRYHIFTAEKRLTAAESLKLTEQACKTARELVVIPTMTYDGEDIEGWAKLARRFVDAGARIIELNMCCPNMSFNLSSTGASTVKHTGASLGNDLVEMPKVVKSIVDAVAPVPVIVKFSADGNMAPAAARLAIKAGAAAVGHNGNFLGIPDIDIKEPLKGIYRLQDQITLGCMSGALLRPLCLRVTYQMRQSIGGAPVLLSSGGATDLKTAVEHILVGGDGVWICTETMIRGFDWLPKMIEQLKAYMKEMGYSKITDFRDLLHKNIAAASGLTIHSGCAEFDEEKCTACGACWKIGHCCAITSPDGKTVYDRERCLACSTCVDVCPTGAFSMTQTD